MSESINKPRKTEAGFLAILFSLLFAVPLIVQFVSPLLPPRLAESVSYKSSNFIFDFGAIAVLGLILCSTVGLYQGGRSRKLARVTLVIVLAPILVGIVGLCVAMMMGKAPN